MLHVELYTNKRDNGVKRTNEATCKALVTVGTAASLIVPSAYTFHIKFHSDISSNI